MRSHVRSIALLCCLILAVTPLISQQGGSKEATKFRSQIEDTRKSVEQARKQLEEILAQYNGLIGGKAKKPDAAYKKLDGDVGKVEKTVSGIQKQVANMDKGAEKFFAAWEEQIDAFSGESMREQGQKRLQLARTKYDDMRTNMSSAGEAYAPFMASLKDQVLYMGTDLSPEALEALQPETEKLNQMGEELFARIDRILSEEAADEQEFDEAVGEDNPEDMGDDDSGDDDAPAS